MKQILIVYFSLGGHTRELAEEIRAATGADIEEIAEVHPRCGVRGMLRALWDASWRRKTRIHPPRHDPAGYDLLVLGGPIWARHLAAPVRSFAEQHCKRTSHVAFFCTEGGSGADVAFADLERLGGKHAIATLVVDAKHLNPADHRSDLGRFVASVMRVGDGGTGAANARETGTVGPAMVQVPGHRV